MKIVVVGGGGYLGSRCVAALRALGHTPVVASRSGETRVDLGDPSTFEALVGADVVVDLADTTSSRPDALASFCLARGLVLVETSSDPETMRRLAALRRDSAAAAGAVVLGAGIFTGVSNLLARDAARRASDEVGKHPDVSVTLGVSSNPYSGAGTGTIALMVAGLARNATRHVDGVRVEAPPVARGPRIAFPTTRRPTLRMAFAEQEMLGPSLGCTNADVLFAPRPAFLVAAFLALPGFVLRSGAFALFMRVTFTFLRAFVLRGKTSMVEMAATAKNGKVTARRTAIARDGMTAGGNAAAAIAHEIGALGGERRPRGVVFVDEVLDLDPVVETANRAAGENVASRIALGSEASPEHLVSRRGLVT